MVIEGLSLLIKEAKGLGKLVVIKLSSTLVVTHIFFVGDVVLFGIGKVNEWQAFVDLLKLFCGASGMAIIVEKSVFLRKIWSLSVLCFHIVWI